MSGIGPPKKQNAINRKKFSLRNINSQNRAEPQKTDEYAIPYKYIEMNNGDF
jgi:hypothetical protein